MSLPISTTRTYMLAASAPLLENQKLCGFLEKMDEAEVIELAKEEQPVKDKLDELEETYSWKNIFFKGGLAALTGGTIAGGAKYTYDHTSLAENKFNESEMLIASFNYCLRNSAMDPKLSREANRQKTDLFEASWIQRYRDSEAARLGNSTKESVKWFVITAAIIGFVVVSKELLDYNAEKSVFTKTSNFRINDVRELRIKRKIRDIEQRLLQPQEEAETTQLPIAKDYFVQRQREMDLSKPQRIDVTVRHYNYV